MLVNKDQFDSLLGRMIKSQPEKTATIKSEKKGPTIIAPRPVSPRQ
jgi:hypothetical protein